MFYNVSFIFEKPFRFYTTEQETAETVSKDIFDLYQSGNFIKGEDGKPKLKERPVEIIKTEQATPIQQEILESIQGLYELISETRGE